MNTASIIDLIQCSDTLDLNSLSDSAYTALCENGLDGFDNLPTEVDFARMFNYDLREFTGEAVPIAKHQTRPLLMKFGKVSAERVYQMQNDERAERIAEMAALVEKHQAPLPGGGCNYPLLENNDIGLTELLDMPQHAPSFADVLGKLASSALSVGKL